MEFAPNAVLAASSFDSLLSALRDAGFRPIGPTVEGGAVVYAELDSAADLPLGAGDEQDGGRYRLTRREDGALFGHAVGPHSWKSYLHPPALRLFSARREASGFAIEEADSAAPPRAFVGVRPCELAAIAKQDRVLTGGTYVDGGYRARREAAFLVAVQCAEPGGTCFCASMGTGPRATAGFDLALTELLDDGRHEFLVEAGSARGARLLETLPCRPATDADEAAARRVSDRAAARMGRSIETDGLPRLLRDAGESARWEEIAKRCLSCANCTMVCPTCFCTTVEDTTDLTGDHAERWRRWDSCFTLDFSYIHGGAVRRSAASRYRQWLTHKLSTWHEQFGESGCVGCGRCITWCPVGIDLTAEAAAFRGEAAGAAAKE